MHSSYIGSIPLVITEMIVCPNTLTNQLWDLKLPASQELVNKHITSIIKAVKYAYKMNPLVEFLLARMIVHPL